MWTETGIMRYVLLAVSICLVAAAVDCWDYRAYEDNKTVVVEAGGLRVEVSKFPWQLSIYDNVTGDLILHDPWNYSPGFGRWEGEYLDLYEGYLWREGSIEEWHQLIAVTDVDRLPHAVLLTANTTDPGTKLTLELTDFRFRQMALRFSVNPSARWNRFEWAFSILEEDEGFFGFGERFNAVNQRGNKVGNWAEDGSWGLGRLLPNTRIPGGNTSTYLPMPLFLSSRGYGLQLNTTYRSEFDSETDVLAMRIRTETSKLAATVFAGRSVRESFSMMSEINGKSLIPPPWVFGPWNQLNTEKIDVNDTERARELLLEQKIPVSVAIESLHFFPEGDDRGKHQALLMRNTQLLYMGLPTLAYFNPMVETSWNSTWADLAHKGFFTRNQQGQPFQFLYLAAKLFHVSQIDFTNPGAIQWYQTQLQSALNLKYKGWMYDFGEYTPHSSVNFINQTGLQSHNQYPVLYQKACYDLMTRNWTSPDYAPDLMFYHRSGYLGSQRFTWAHWTGDPSSDWTEASGLPAQLKASLSVGVSGLPFSGSDIGGFEWYTGAAPDLELWVRWTQLGAFSGLMHEQGGGKGFGPKTHIFDTPEGTRMWKKFARLRTQLFPYIYTAAHVAHYTGLPLMRHHVLDEHLDTKAIGLDDQYMLGDSLLVAPVLTAGQTSRRVYLPKGCTWMDVSSSLRYEETEGVFRISAAKLQPGGVFVQVPAPLETCPLFVRAGTIVPLLGPAVLTLSPAAHPNITSMDKEHELHLWAWTNASKEASGEDWQHNAFKVFPLSAHSSDVAVWTSIASHQYKRIVTQLAIASMAHAPRIVRVHEGENYTAVSSWKRVAMGNTTSTWYCDEDAGVVWLASSGKVIQVDVLF